MWEEFSLIGQAEHSSCSPLTFNLSLGHTTNLIFKLNI